MTINPTPFPLYWPSGQPRSTDRTPSTRFSRSAADAMRSIEKDLVAIGATALVISSNSGGLTRTAPADRGVAAWFLYRNAWRCIAVDRYADVRGNICGIARTVEALRTIHTHGGMQLFDQAVSGFQVKALPAGRPWRAVLGDCRSIEDVEAAYKTMRPVRHPDKHDGDRGPWDELHEAYEAARVELS